jgi:hypothetical protein
LLVKRAICKSGATTHRVTLDTQGQLVLKPDNQPAYRLAPQEGRRFRIAELEGFFVEFRGEGTIIDELIFSSAEWHVRRKARGRIILTVR